LTFLFATGFVQSRKPAFDACVGNKNGANFLVRAVRLFGGRLDYFCLPPLVGTVLLLFTRFCFRIQFGCHIQRGFQETRLLFGELIMRPLFRRRIVWLEIFQRLLDAASVWRGKIPQVDAQGGG
jgi:hypothetical protein